MSRLEPESVEDLKPRGVKAPLALLPYKPLRAISAAMLEGASKYAPWNWVAQTGDHRQEYGSALLRHVLSYTDPNVSDYDTDSGVHHLAHAGACVVILLFKEGVDYVQPNAAKRKE